MKYWGDNDYIELYFIKYDFIFMNASDNHLSFITYKLISSGETEINYETILKYDSQDTHHV